MFITLSFAICHLRKFDEYATSASSLLKTTQFLAKSRMKLDAIDSFGNNKGFERSTP